MDPLLWVAAGSVCFIGSWLLLRRRQRRRAEADAAPQTPLAPPARGGEVGLADVLLIEKTDWVVEGVARFEEASAVWCECRLTDGADESWLVIADEAVAALTGQTAAGARLAAEAAAGGWWGRRISDPGVGGGPSDSLELEGRVYRLASHGLAQVTPQGKLAQVFSGAPCRYWNYQHPGAARLWIRRVDERWFFFAGQHLQGDLITWLPGRQR